jgi:hypothetical protein
MKLESYLLKLKIKNVKRDVWRKVIVPSTISLDRLHDVIQIVMVWEDYAPHSFVIDEVTYSEINPFEEEIETDEFEDGNEYVHSLKDLVSKKGATFQYFYHNDAKWEVEITIENNKLVYPPQNLLVQCIGGKMFSPMEEVVSPENFEDICNALEDKDSQLYKDFYENNPYGSILYNFGSINPDIINNELRKYLLWSRDRLIDWFED